MQKRFKSAKKIWQASSASLVKAGLSKRLVQEFGKYRQKNDIYSLSVWFEKNLIKYITFDNKIYPRLLKNIPNPPFLLFVKSRLNLKKVFNNNLISVVGTRKPTNYGKRVCKQICQKLTLKKWTIVSGLARGIDGLAHQTVVDSQGLTIAVLAHGMERVYPPEHRFLASKIIKSGALVSERPPFCDLNRSSFAVRNRIIAGLSKGVVVVEGKSRSGTKITANFAVDYNREVFAVPGPIDSVQSQIGLELIQSGAKLITNTKDILSEV